MSYRYFELGYRIVKVGRRTVSCAMGALGATKLRPYIVGTCAGSSMMLAAVSMVGALAPGNAVAQSMQASVTMIDGGELSGFLIDDNVTIEGQSSNTLTSYKGKTFQLNTEVNKQTVFTGFVTEGGAGSGGGAGLGGVFFVDANATLTISDVVFAGNTVKGGTGGGEPSQRLGNVSLAVASKTIDVFSFNQSLALPEVTNSGGAYVFQSIDLSATGTDMLSPGSTLTFGSLSSTPSAEIDSISRTDQVILKNPVTISSADITSVDAYQPPALNSVVPQSYGYTVSGNTIDLTRASDAQRQAVKDAVELNSMVFIDGVSSRVSASSFDDEGKLETITLTDDALSGQTGKLDIISLSSFSTKQFVVDAYDATTDTTRITLTGDLSGFSEGMQLFDADGNPLGFTIKGVSDTENSFTVSGNAASIDDRVDFVARQSPVLSNTQFRLNSPRDDFYEGATVYFSDLDKEMVVSAYDPSTGVLTFASQLTSEDVTALTDLSDDGKSIELQLKNIISSSGTSLTVRATGLNLKEGMVLQGSGLADGTAIDKLENLGNDVVRLTLTDAPDDASALSFIVAKSPLTKGGNMNDMATPSTGANGDNGVDSNGVAAFFEGGEGQPGTYGYSGEDCSEGACGVGGDGGVGGNGSDGMPINPQAIAEVYGATGDFIDATGELAAAIFPDPVAGLAVPIPDPLEIAGATVDLAFNTLALSEAIYQTVTWAINLDKGIAGLGGDGGDGGEAGGGSDFFGGGAGGNGGIGGEGALSHTDGGAGGNGGRGGDGGFGAGGGQGGAGGDAGSTGAAPGGDPGDGGFAGFGAGDGSNGNNMFGGGGSGFGAAIFVREGGSLTIKGNSHFLNNVARGGSSTNRGAAGDGAGAGLFIMTLANNVTLEPGLGKVIQFDDDIADDSSATYEGAQYAEGEGADLTILGDGGLVIFNAENTYSGDTILKGATLQADFGTGIHDSSRLRFDGSADIVDKMTSLSLGTTGTLLQADDLVERRVGNDPFEIKWSGSGGFASSEENGISINLGETVPGVGQHLIWGSDGFFEGATTSVLTFGSEQSAGTVTFMNDVTVPTGRTATVAVYNTGATDPASSSAILSGNWSGDKLVVGEAGTNYTGALYLTGQNSLDEVIVSGGKLSTFNAADPTSSGKLFDAGADVDVKEGGTLELYGTETVASVTIDPVPPTTGTSLPDGKLRVYGAMSAASVDNGGELRVDSGTDIMGTSDGAGGMLKTAGSLNVTGTLSNLSAARVIQKGAITAATEVINDGDWNVVGSSELKITNAATGGTDAGLTGTGSFCLETEGGDAALCDGESEDPQAVATTLTLNQAGDSTFDGVFAGLGALVKTDDGELTLAKTQTFLGGLTVNDGAIIADHGNATATDMFADTLAITVNLAGRLDLETEDTFGSLTNFGTVNVNANQTVASVDNKAEVTEGDGDGLINLRADITATGDFKNDGRVEVLGGDRTLNVATLTGAGAFDGDDAVTPRDLTIYQSGTSTYAGSITGVDDLVKQGDGSLTLTGTNAYTGTGLVEAGTLVIATPAAMDVGNDYLVSDQATLRIESSTGLVTGDQVTVDDRGFLDVASAFKATLLSNSGVSTLDAELEISTYLNNTETGRVDASADVTARNVDNDGVWNVLSSGHLTLNGTGTSAGLTGVGSFCLETAGSDIDACNGLPSGPDAEAVATTLTLNQAGDSTFDGVFAGKGALEKTGSGSLTLTNAQTFLGGLTVSNGAVLTGQNVGASTVGTFADTLAITVNTNGLLDVNNTDTFGSLTNFGTANVNADQSVVAAQTLGGTLNLNANLTTIGAFSVDDEGSNLGVVNINGDYTITADGGLTGNGDIIVDDGHNLTLSQKAGTISTFRGTITSDTDPNINTSSFTLVGGGQLILAGSTDQVSVGKLYINDGRISLDGPELLDDEIAVAVADLGALELLDANDGTTVRTESIRSLEGAGEIYLGRNTLNVVNGGSFTGEFFGTGSVNVENGDFQISSSLTSTQGSLMVSNSGTDGTGGTIVSRGTNVAVSSVSVMSGGRLNVAGTGTEENDVSRITTNNMVVQTDATLHMGTGSYSTDAEGHSVIEADDILINGTFAGNGSLVAPSITVTAESGLKRAEIKPGDSPGVQMFMGDRTVFGSNSTLQIEVLDHLEDPGIGFDQVRFKSGGMVVLEGNSVLEVVDLNEPNGPSFNSSNYSLGQTINFAKFDPLTINGQFGSVVHTALASNSHGFVVNLATGNLVGVGTRDIDDAAGNLNQRRMLDGLRVSSEGGVDQFYGGTLVEDITSAWANGRDLDAVFERASPEAYAGLGASAQAAALNAAPKWVSGFAGSVDAQGSFVDMSTTNYAADDDNGGQMAFGVATTNATVGFNQGINDEVSLIFTLGNANTDLDGKYTRGSGSGLTAGLAFVGKFSGSNGLTWQAGIRHASLTLDGTRTTNNGSVTFGDVDANATQANLGLEYQGKTESMQFGLRANLAFGSSTSDGFSEASGPQNPLDAMAVSAIKDDYAQLDFGAQVGKFLTAATRVFGEADISIPLSSSEYAVGSSYDTEQGVFSVGAYGLDTPSVAVSFGVDQRISETGVVSLSVGAGNGWNNDTYVRAGLSAKFQF